MLSLIMANRHQDFCKHKIHMANYVLTPLLLLASTALSAQDNSQPFIHAVTEHLPPYQIISADKSKTGFAIDIINETMQRSGYQYSVESYPWVRTYNLAQQKENHCIFSIARLASRETLFKWVGKISQASNTVIWGLKERNIIIKSLNEAKKYTIAVNKNDIGHTGLLERGFTENENLYVLEDTRSLVKLLATRPEIDLIIADDSTIDFRAELAGVPITQLRRVFEIDDMPLNFYFACSKHTHDDVVTNLSTSLQSLHQDGTYNNIWQKWQSKLQKSHVK